MLLVCAIGDLLLDVVVRLDGPIAADTDAYGRTRVGAGGQAANVAAWAASLGGRGRFIGKRARDPAGRIAAEEASRRGVELCGPEVAGGTGTVVSLATPDGRRAMLSDRGVSPEFAPEELDDAWLDGCDWLHVPGYSLVRAPLSAAAARAAALAPRVSVDASSTAAIEAVGAARFAEAVEALAPSILFATEAEAALLDRVATETLVVKRGADGCIVRTRGEEREYEALPAEVVDATGAGDAFAAGFLLDGPELALQAAARCVATMGAFPS